MRLEYDVVDVFTDRPFAGNPLAVVYGAEHLTTAQLLAITREFNLSETTFPVALTEADRAAGADYRVRIFTPGGEIPFAGHPTLGTAWSLRHHELLSAGQRVQICGVGPIGVSVPADPDEPLELSAAPRDLSPPLSAVAVAGLADSIGLEPADVVGPVHAAGCGLSFVYVRVQPEALSRARPGSVPLRELPLDVTGLRDPLEGVNVFALEEESDAGGGPGRDQTAEQRDTAGQHLQVRARVFVPGLSVAEDPATGSAAVGLGPALVALGLVGSDGETTYRIEQGVEMGRPSLLYGRVRADAGRATECWVAGRVVPVASGTIAVPSSR